MNEWMAVQAGNAVLRNLQNAQEKPKVETDPVRLKEAAREFEALFLGLMLKEMRSTIEDSGFGGKGLGQSTYTEMFDAEVARALAERGALGIADLLVRNLANRPGVK